MDGRVRHDATLRTLAAELCDRGCGRAEGQREAEGCPDPAGAGGVRGQAHATELLPGRLKDEFYRSRTWPPEKAKRLLAGCPGPRAATLIALGPHPPQLLLNYIELIEEGAS